MIRQAIAIGTSDPSLNQNQRVRRKRRLLSVTKKAIANGMTSQLIEINGPPGLVFPPATAKNNARTASAVTLRSARPGRSGLFTAGSTGAGMKNFEADSFPGVSKSTGIAFLQFTISVHRYYGPRQAPWHSYFARLSTDQTLDCRPGHARLAMSQNQPCSAAR